ncbi:hypothetical protein QBC47DRAFT_365981 [Echria macrotheca]|uniref:Uncharacterized protein n=1 Tax=Echria macrotheca TaxID=438768 RepID=A0AAJ0F5X3_9PEZI|nr:hypothetical protein QBC47DRAFT_365981 [Echria macrotheca]
MAFRFTLAVVVLVGPVMVTVPIPLEPVAVLLSMPVSNMWPKTPGERVNGIYSSASSYAAFARQCVDDLKVHLLYVCLTTAVLSIFRTRAMQKGAGSCSHQPSRWSRARSWGYASECCAWRSRYL